ncbi:hypothetical protein PUN28_010378 [Cardiocondyla obscurior]|uniref:THAP-type domain-containing protein n=1 Tax=Cardiocondyla obscurior TaxID=286306 RepID=A0AAW2FQ09_9HYME
MRICGICKVEQAINPHLTFHSLPKNSDIRKQWLEIMKKKDSIKTAFVCNQHFKPEDYRDFCDRPILKNTAVPRLNIEDELNTCVESIEHDSMEVINFQDYDAEIDDCTETIELVTDENIKCSKRKNDSSGDESSVASKKHCNLKKFGIFRKEDFNDEKLWNRFLVAFEEMRKEKVLLERKNKRLYEKVQKYKHIVEELKEKNLLTGLVADMLSIR